jgi:hypothetical protein
MLHHNILWFLDIFRPDSLCEPDILPQLLAWIRGWYSLQRFHMTSVDHISIPRSFLIPVALILLASVSLIILFLLSKKHRAAVNRQTSEQFGEALERAGIVTQPAASK